MTTNLISIDSSVVIEKRNDLRIYASDSETLNEETALKTECNYLNDFGWKKFELPTEFFSKKHLHFVYVIYNYIGSITDTCTLVLNKVSDQKYTCRESAYNLNDSILKRNKDDFRIKLSDWGESHKLSIRIIKYRKPAFKSTSKSFPKKEIYILTTLTRKSKTQLTDNEREVVNFLFNIVKFDSEWFFTYSAFNKRLKLSVQDFDAIIESLLQKKVLEKSPYNDGYRLNVTI